MSTQALARDSKRTLNEALESGQLSAPLMKQGREMLAELQQVLRLSVFGLPQSGKSTLMNLLLGADVIPKGVTLPTLSLRYGDSAVAHCTLSNGEVTRVAHDDLIKIAALNPVYVEIETPNPALRRLSMMEVVTGADTTGQQRAIQWASRRTDIALWCTQYTTPEEAALWDLFPDNVLDHTFLMLTKTDLLAANGTLAEDTARAQSLGQEALYKVLPVDTLGATRARLSDGSIDKNALRETGGMATISAILREVEKGERAAADAVDVFLMQAGYDQTLVAPREIEANPAAISAPAPTPEVPQPVAQTASLGPDARAACAQVIEQLIAEGNALAHQLKNDTIEATTIVDVSVDTVTWVAEYLSETITANDSALCEIANDAADLVQLVKLEKGGSVATDALSLMIQLKHELQAELAA